jgi:hypothetical protein
MGWNSWNSFANVVKSDIIQQQAKAMATNGMKQAGYQYVVIDEGWWLGDRDSAGNIVVNPKQWPALKPGEKDGDMSNIVRFIHDLGLKAGIYTDAGRNGCSMYPDSGPKYFHTGSEDHYQQDFLQFSKWGFDYVKVDWCGGSKENESGAVQYAKVARVIQQAENTTGRALFFSICEWGSQNPWYWAPGVGEIRSTIWRTGGDIIPPIVDSLHDAAHEKRRITLANVLDSFDTGMHPEAQHTGYYNDLDMMVMGMRGMTPAMDRIHMGLWAISSAPLMVGSDLTRLSSATLSLLTNKNAIAIHNDPFGLQPIKIAEPTPGLQIWAKPMSKPGTRAVALLNRTSNAADVKISDLDRLGLTGPPASIHDIWNNRDFTLDKAAIPVPAGDLLLLLINGHDKPSVDYAASQTDITGIQATGRPTFAELQYRNQTGHTAIIHVHSTSGFSTALALPSDVASMPMILPHGVADLSFDAPGVTIHKLTVHTW